MDSGGDILDDCLYVPLGGHLVVAVSAGRLVEAVVVLVELLALLRKECLVSVGANYSLGSRSQFGP